MKLDTSKGAIVFEIHCDWSPHGVDHFYNLVRAGYYDDCRFSRVIAGQWAQFGINGEPEIAKLWRDRPIPDDPHSVQRARHARLRVRRAKRPDYAVIHQPEGQLSGA